MKDRINRVLIILLVTNLSACGFQMRGSHLDHLANSSIYVQSKSGSDLAMELKKQLALSSITVADSASNADYIIALREESYERDVLSVSADTGKVEEYELLVSTLLSITGPDKNSLVNSEPVTARRDYIFDQDSALAEFTEEEKIRQEMNTQIAATIIRRLRIVSQ